MRTARQQNAHLAQRLVRFRAEEETFSFAVNNHETFAKVLAEATRRTLEAPLERKQKPKDDDPNTKIGRPIPKYLPNGCGSNIPSTRFIYTTKELIRKSAVVGARHDRRESPWDASPLQAILLEHGLERGHGQGQNLPVAVKSSV